MWSQRWLLRGDVKQEVKLKWGLGKWVKIQPGFAMIGQKKTKYRKCSSQICRKVAITGENCKSANNLQTSEFALIVGISTSQLLGQTEIRNVSAKTKVSITESFGEEWTNV